MDLRNPAMAKLTIIAVWATLGGLPSGLVIGLFLLVYEDGHRRGLLPPQPHPVPLGLREAFPTVAVLASRLAAGDRNPER